MGLDFTLKTDGGCGCQPNNGIGFSLGNPNPKECFNPCPHAHQLDGGSAWSSYISAPNSAAWVGKMPQWNGSEFIPVSGGGGGSGTVTSVAATISGALSVGGSPITTSGTLAFAWTGTSSQYVLGNGTLATIITNNNQLINGEGFITSAALSGYLTTAAAAATYYPLSNPSGYISTAITSLGGLSASTQLFANDTNVTITSAVSTHTLGWSGELSGTRGGTGVNNGARTITIAGNLITTGAFNTTFAQQITGTFTLPPVAGTIAASASTLTSGRVPYVTTSGMLTDSSNMTWDNTNKYLYLALTSRVGSSGNSYVEFGASNATTVFSNGTANITGNTSIALNGTLQNGITLFVGNYSYFQSTRTFLNNYTGNLTNGCSGGSFGIRQSADFVFNTVTTNTTANASTTITLANGTFSSNGGVQAIGLGDYISLSSASSTYAAVTAIASSTSITVSAALGNGTTQTVNVKPAIFRIFDNASVPNLKLSMNYLGYLGMSNPNPTAWLHLVASTTAAASLNMPSGTAPTTPNNGDIWFDGTDIKMRIGGVTKTFTLI